jgi:tetratricopeptide (TPR) repeat protein
MVADGASLVDLAAAAERDASRDVASSMASSDVVLALADASGEPTGRVRARTTRGHVLAHAGRHVEAIDVLREGIALAEAAGASAEAARCRAVLVHPLAQTGALNEARRVGEAARRGLLDAGLERMAANVDLSLGAVLRMADEPAAALTHYDRARAALADAPMLVARLDVNRGNALLALDDFAEAAAAYAAALPVFVGAGQHWIVAVIEENLAELARVQGKLDGALRHFERARRLMEQDEAPADLARIEAEHAQVQLDIGLFREAADALEAVVPKLDQHELRWEAARARANLAAACIRLGERKRADALLAASADAFAQLNHVGARATVDLLRSEVAQAAGDLDSAMMLADRALSAMRDRPAQAGAAHYRLASCHLEAGALDGAEMHVESALALADSMQLGPLRADALHLRGELHRRRGSSAGAVDDLRAAVEEAERLRSAMPAERLRAAAMGRRIEVYESLVAAILDVGGASAVRDAFEVAERAKSRALLDLVRGELDVAQARPLDSDDETSIRLTGELAALRASLHAAYARLDELASPDQRAIAPSVFREEVQRCEAQIELLEDRLASGSGNRRSEGSMACVVPVSDVAASLGDAVFVEYFLAEDELMAFVLCRGELSVETGLASHVELQEAIGRLHFQVGRTCRGLRRAHTRSSPRREDLDRELRRLHGLLIDPVRDRLGGADRLVIAPHGPLHALPWAALRDRASDQYLCDRHVVTTVPSAAILAHRDTDRTRRTRALVVGVHDVAAPRIQAEARRLADLLQDRLVLLGDDATRQRVVEACRDVALIHIACHGRYVAQSPLSSGLRLADGWMTARDTARLSLRSPLVVLSGCETGRNLVGAGDELMGLVRGFLSAGAAAILAALWPISDRAAERFMEVFYGELRLSAEQAGYGGRALRSAQLAVREEMPHPVHWAAFGWVGAP